MAKGPKTQRAWKWEYILAPESVEAYGLRLYTQVLGWSPDKARIHHALVKQQLRDKSMHAYFKVMLSTGESLDRKQLSSMTMGEPWE
ncbi:hypothetical protein VTN77DRAFT_7858 [Rasamsonia byssochlamydoides]|uniref:uncharacterized protein n=1 Tax=Rasamsonia byssochlamydoides TaxID=89139 RepID=UPI0037429055